LITRFRDLRGVQKEAIFRHSHGVWSSSDEVMLWCRMCGRAMLQGDCLIDRSGYLACPEPGCPGRLSYDLTPYDDLRLRNTYAHENWPAAPEPGSLYSLGREWEAEVIAFRAAVNTLTERDATGDF
jgi:hypothetical protein